MKSTLVQFCFWAFLSCITLASGQASSGRSSSVWLQMQLDSGSFMQVAHVPVEILVIGGKYAISPSSLSLRLSANESWQLYMNFEANGNNKHPLQLRVRANKGTWNPLWDYPTKIRQGHSYAGTMSFKMGYGLLGSVPPDGRYTGIVTYTLYGKD